MIRNKPSFFERLTGATSIDDYEDDIFDEEVAPAPRKARHIEIELEDEEKGDEEGRWIEEEGQLSVDVYQTADQIIIKAIVAGVRPDHLDVSITRDMVTIKGKREEAKEVTEENYFYKELYWGSFARTILLPQEIEPESAEANEKHGVLTIKLPKIDKDRETKLKVKGS
ncbi:MAG: Hsp20/alpha crystallin family protein [Candidatus Pacebacteria bacterium]|nr:Hsp20/alpha crystallin family protein [Candidatus Paceibacterota bacterium]